MSACPPGLAGAFWLSVNQSPEQRIVSKKIENFRQLMERLRVLETLI
jgi:hypothetical protein